MGNPVDRGDSLLTFFKKKDCREIHRPFMAWLEWIYNWWWLKRFWYKQMNLIVMEHDEKNDYTHWHMKCARRFLPKNAVHISRRRGWFFLDLASKEVYPKPITYDECSATDIHTFRKNNSIRDAVRMAGTLNEPLDMKKIITIGVVLIIVVVIAWSVMGGGK